MLMSYSSRGRRVVALALIACFVVSGIPVIAPAQPPPATPPAMPPPGGGGGEKLISLAFREAPLDQVLKFYSELTGRTMLKTPNINATVTLETQTRVTLPEAMQAIESVLAMNNVTLLPMGSKFLKVVATGTARKEAMKLSVALPDKPFPDTDTLISQIIPLKYVEYADVQPVLTPLLHGYGTIQELQRSNSLLITETAANLQIILDILALIDQPAEAKVEIRIYELKYAEAAKIASRLNELVADSQAKEEKPRVAAAAAAPETPPGVIRARQPAAAAAAAIDLEAAMAERGIVAGKVKIIADDRTNILIVISRPSNFALFDKIVAVLDRPVDPEVIVRVFALEYADATEISGILNDFIGAAKAETPKGAAAPAAAGQAAPTQTPEARALQDYVRQRAEDRLRTAVGEGVSRIGQLSPNTKILSDKRTNSLLLMGTKGDIAALEEVIDKLDIMLAQVLIEAVILEVKLSKSVQYGVDWLQRSMTVYSESKKGAGGGVAVRDPRAAYGGGWSSASRKFTDASQIDRDVTIGQGLTYYLSLYDLNIDAVISMVAASSDARVLSTPVVLTTDNTEATINSSEQRPVVTQTSTTDAGAIRSSYEYRDIGIQLKVKPRINPARYVVLDITQTADTPGDEVLIDGNKVPSIFKRELQASIAVPSRSTIVLGGLVQSDRKNSRTKVPILGDIPLLGTLFRSDDRSQTRTELLVLITPYVLMTPEEARQETERLHKASLTAEVNWQRGWSDSPLGDLSPDEKRAQKLQERERLKKEAVEKAALEAAQKAKARAAAKPESAAAIEPKYSVIPPQPRPVESPKNEAPVEPPKAAPAEPKADVPAQPAAVEPAVKVEAPAPAAVPPAEASAGRAGDADLDQPVPLR